MKTDTIPPVAEISDVEKLANEPNEGRAEEINAKFFKPTNTGEAPKPKAAKKGKKAKKGVKAPKATPAEKPAKKADRPKKAPKPTKAVKPAKKAKGGAKKAKKDLDAPKQSRSEAQMGRHGMTLESGRRKPGTRPPYSDEAEAYGKKVRRARDASEMTQRDLAAMLSTKTHTVGQPTIANIERGVAGASDDMKTALAKALGEPKLAPKTT